MARKLQIVVTTLLALASFACLLGGVWRGIQIVNSWGAMGIPVDAAGRPIVHPANFDTFPYFSAAVVAGLLAVIVATKPDPDRFSMADMFTATTLVAVALACGAWLAS